MTTKYRCWDESWTEIDYEAESPQAAAEAYVADGEWGERDQTMWIDVWVAEVGTDVGEIDAERLLDESDRHTVTLQPIEPDCHNDAEHDWQTPLEVVGGIAENPGCWGHGGGVIQREVCAHCGTYRVTDTWAQRPDTGEQGLTSVRYEDADETSLAWVEKPSYTTLEDARTALENSGVNEWITDDERAAVIDRMFRDDLTPEQAAANS